MGAKHTPVVARQHCWSARFSGHSNGWTIYGHDENGEYLVAENIGPYADDDEAEQDAEREARLIASAPDLLEALTECLAALTDPVVGTIDGDDPDWYRKVDAAVNKACAAIRKATGEAS
jgi:hypothetical protein